MTDIVEELRALASIDQSDAQRWKAADEIKRLRKDVEHWREARRSCIAAGDMMLDEIKRLRDLLREARDYVQECCDRETKKHSIENDQRLLSAIDEALGK